MKYIFPCNCHYLNVDVINDILHFLTIIIIFRSRAHTHTPRVRYVDVVHPLDFPCRNRHFNFDIRWSDSIRHLHFWHIHVFKCMEIVVLQPFAVYKCRLCISVEFIFPQLSRCMRGKYGMISKFIIFKWQAELKRHFISGIAKRERIVGRN